MAKVLSKTVLYEGRLTGVRERVLLPNGREVNHESILHPGAVVILPKTPSGIIFLRQYRHSVGRTILELPAGTLESGEDPDRCAKRELVEEIGCEVQQWHNLGTLIPAPGFCNEIQHVFVAENLIQGETRHEADELIEIEELSMDQVENSIRTGELIDAKSLALYCRAKLCGLL